ncbi:PTS sugar transporter subunit IIA [Ornithinibacillus gellani]|uniref:PTS sugar transporter subunit IIA n=1 Tax=Ornithinibacillus gellani TaxID=2293253 RepID=UPI000F493F7F|nr:PTS sugar transporter subunit IIA [Ornithinibacillus gellani]TQS71191.1 PTS sugar transporter subunit IIA [Ornithinibacillus gellani]
MIGLVLTGHGAFPTGMLESIQLITGEIDQIKVIPFEDDQDKLSADIEKAIEAVDSGQGVVCFTDLAGGTPFNVSSRLAAQKDNVRVIGGTNSPMLLSVAFQRELELDAFVELALTEGKNNIKAFELKKAKEQESDDDGI